MFSFSLLFTFLFTCVLFLFFKHPFFHDIRTILRGRNIKVLRLLRNGVLSVEDVEQVKYGIEYYVSRHKGYQCYAFVFCENAFFGSENTFLPAMYFEIEAFCTTSHKKTVHEVVFPSIGFLEFLFFWNPSGCHAQRSRSCGG